MRYSENGPVSFFAMALSTRSYAGPYTMGGGLPRGVKLLLILNVVVFLFTTFAGNSELGRWFMNTLGLRPADVLGRFFVWQPVSYLFLHGGIFHILYNMLGLWFFGGELERLWGTDKFLRFYFICGVGAGVVVVLANYLFGDAGSLTIGASGAIYGILLVAAVLWPDRIIILYIFPIKLKYFAMLIGVIALFNLRNINSGVSDVAHLSGMLFGYLFLKLPAVRKFDPLSSARKSYRDWQLARAKKKFQVYMRKHKSDDGPWVQ